MTQVLPTDARIKTCNAPPTPEALWTFRLLHTTGVGVGWGVCALSKLFPPPPPRGFQQAQALQLLQVSSENCWPWGPWDVLLSIIL